MPTFTDQQVAAMVASANSIIATLGPPVTGQQPENMIDASTRYVIDHLTVTPAEFDKASTSQYVSFTIVNRNTLVSPSEGAPIYNGVPICQASVDADPTDNTTVDVFALHGTDNIPSVRHAVANGEYFINKVAITGMAEVWGWDANGKAWNLRTGLRVGSDSNAAPAESVIVSGQASPVLVG
jgi:hypothetical protein